MKNASRALGVERGFILARFQCEHLANVSIFSGHDCSAQDGGSSGRKILLYYSFRSEGKYNAYTMYRCLVSYPQREVVVGV